MRSPHIIVPKWDVRSLNKGFVWQAYRLPCIKFITEQQFKERFGGRMAEMRGGSDRYLQDVSHYAYRRCQQLGLELDAVLQRLCEHPDPSKPLEVALWKPRQAQFVWVVWIHVRGPMLEPYRREGFLPLEGLWPPHVRQINGIAELIDAPRLTLIEQGQLPSTDLYDVEWVGEPGAARAVSQEGQRGHRAPGVPP